MTVVWWGGSGAGLVEWGGWRELGRDPSAAQADIRYANEEKASACFGRDDGFFGGAEVGFGVEGSATLFWSGMTGLGGAEAEFGVAGSVAFCFGSG